MSPPTSSRTLVAWTYLLIAVNVALCISPTGRKFIPSELAIWLGFVYGALCATLHGSLISLARKRAPLTDENGTQRTKPIGGPLLIVIILQLGIGTAGFAEGVGGLYTQSFGSLSDRTYTVSNVRRSGKARCWKHWFDELSYAQVVLGAPCLESKFPIESRFVFKGRASRLGFKYDEYTVQRPNSERPR